MSYRTVAYPPKGYSAEEELTYRLKDPTKGNKDMEEDMEQQKRPLTSETQELADFLRSTGPEVQSPTSKQDATKEKKKGTSLFRFGKKSKKAELNGTYDGVLSKPDDKPLPPPAMNQLFLNTGRPSSTQHLADLLASAEFSEPDPSITAVTLPVPSFGARSQSLITDAERRSAHQRSEERQDIEEEELYDEEMAEFDEAVLRNTELNAAVHSDFSDPPKPKVANPKNVKFAQMVMEVSVDDEISHREDKPTIKQRHSSLLPRAQEPETKRLPQAPQDEYASPVKGTSRDSLGRDTFIKTSLDKEIQTDGVASKDSSVLMDLNQELLKEREERRALEEQIEATRQMFDQLSTQAYSKLRQLMQERQVMEVELITLRAQLEAVELQTKQWIDEEASNYC